MIADANQLVERHPRQAGALKSVRELAADAVIPRVGGEATQLAGHRITVYRKQPEGRWLLARDAHTLSPVAK